MRAVWGSAPKTLPEVPRRGIGVLRPVRCGAAHLSGLLVSNRLGIPLPAWTPLAPARAFPSQRNRLLAFGSLEALAHRELGMESSIRTLNPCILLHLSLPDCVCSRVGIIHSRPQPLYFTVLEFLRVGLQ